MRLFSHTTAEYVCTKCGERRSVVGANLGIFYVIVAAVAAVPLWIASLRDPWNLAWYFLPCFFAGELLLFFAAGLVASVLYVVTSSGLEMCWHCRGLMRFAGRHFDPAGTNTPHWSDVVILLIFAGLNVIVWYELACNAAEFFGLTH